MVSLKCSLSWTADNFKWFYTQRSLRWQAYTEARWNGLINRKKPYEGPKMDVAKQYSAINSLALAVQLTIGHVVSQRASIGLPAQGLLTRI